MSTLIFPAPVSEGISMRSWSTAIGEVSITVVDHPRASIGGTQINYTVSCSDRAERPQFATIEEVQDYLEAEFDVDGVVLPNS